MTLNELLDYLQENTGFELLDGSPEASIRKAAEGTHPHEIAAEIIRALDEKAGHAGGEASLERIDAVKSLSPLRLKYMADNAPVEGLRMVEKIITTIDAAYNEEALRLRGA